MNEIRSTVRALWRCTTGIQIPAPFFRIQGYWKRDVHLRPESLRRNAFALLTWEAVLNWVSVTTFQVTETLSRTQPSRNAGSRCALAVINKLNLASGGLHPMYKINFWEYCENPYPTTKFLGIGENQYAGMYNMLYGGWGFNRGEDFDYGNQGHIIV
jgi:hypothetical protein